MIDPQLLSEFQALSPPPTDSAIVRTLVLRLPQEQRQEPQQIHLSIEGGIDEIGRAHV